MLKNNTNNDIDIFALSLCSIIFCFTVNLQNKIMSVRSWCFTLAICFIIHLFLIFAINYKNFSCGLISVLCSLYLLFSISHKIYMMCEFMNVYHAEQSMLSIYAIVIIILFFSVKNDYSKTMEISKLLLVMCIILIALTILVNISKFSISNLFVNYTNEDICFEDTMFLDFFFPLFLLSENNKQIKIKIAISSFVLLLFITIFAFGCLQGNMLYTISPMQILFLISSGNLVKNYDGVFNYLVYFIFMSSILLNAVAYMKINKNKALIFLVLPISLLIGYDYLIYSYIFVLIIMFVNGLFSNEEA